MAPTCERMRTVLLWLAIACCSLHTPVQAARPVQQQQQQAAAAVAGSPGNGGRTFCSMGGSGDPTQGPATFCCPGYTGWPFCHPCGKGFWCDGGGQAACPPGQTTDTDTASAPDLCHAPEGAPPPPPPPPASPPPPPLPPNWCKTGARKPVSAAEWRAAGGEQAPLSTDASEPEQHAETFCCPGFYDPTTGVGLPIFCQPCSKGFYCNDGVTHIACPEGTTTLTDTAVSEEECVPLMPPDKPPEPEMPPPPAQPPIDAVCDPCPDLHPDVLMTTGSVAVPPNGLWRVRKWAPRDDLVPEFLCKLEGMQGGMVADVAIRPNGDVMLIDLACRIYIMTAGEYEALVPTSDQATTCTPRYVASLAVPPGHTCTGISGGWRRNLLMVSLNDGDVVVYEVQDDPSGGGGLITGVRSRAEAKSDPWSARDGTTGGTDVTPAPDGSFYRFVAKDRNNSYTGTRFYMRPNGLFNHTHAYTNRQLAQGDDKFSNAGSFCTSEYAVGVAARNHKAGVNRASFFTYGVGEADRGNDVAGLPRMKQVAKTITTAWKMGLRVNGAANRPKC